jgi:acyl carrier protein
VKNSSASTLQAILESALGRASLPGSFEDSTPLLGNIVGLDSMAVIAVLTRIEQDLGCRIADDEVGAEVFETFGSLRRFLEAKQAQAPRQAGVASPFGVQTPG